MILFDTRMNIYNTIVMPYFNYCSTVLGNISKGLSDKIQKLQNRAARILTISNYETHSSILLDELGWVSWENKRLKQLATIMYKIHNNLFPLYLRHIFTKTLNVQEHNVRNSEINCDVPNPKTDYEKGSLHYRVSILWNKIPSEIRNSKQFKTPPNEKAYF